MIVGLEKVCSSWSAIFRKVIEMSRILCVPKVGNDEADTSQASRCLPTL